MQRRLAKFLEAENITQAQFAAALGVGTANVSHILSGRNKPGFDFFASLIKAYPTLNTEWIISGNGSMYKKQVEEKLQVKAENSSDNYYFENELFGMDIPSAANTVPQSISPSPSPSTSPSVRRVIKTVIFYNDGTYQELK